MSGRGRSQANIRLIEAAAQYFEEKHPASVRGCAYHLFGLGIIPDMAGRRHSGCRFS